MNCYIVYNALEEARSKIAALGSAAQKLGTDLAVAKGELHQALTRKSLLSGVGLCFQNLATSHRQIWTGRAMHRKHNQFPLVKVQKLKEAPPKRSRPRRRRIGQGSVILADDSEVGRKVDEIEWLEGVEESINEEEVLQNEEETGYERFTLAETSAKIRQSARGLASVGINGGEQRVARREKRRGVMQMNHERSFYSFSRWGFFPDSSALSNHHQHVFNLLANFESVTIIFVENKKSCDMVRGCHLIFGLRSVTMVGDALNQDIELLP